MEKRDLYDSERNLTGKYIYAGEHPPQDLYYLVVVIFIQNSNGMFLMQKRSKIKGGEWASTGGHPKMGESSFDGIITEVNEELGIDISLYKDKIVLFKTIKASDCFVDLYYLKADIDVNSLTLQEEEVEDAKYFPTNEIENMIKNNMFKKSHGKMYEECIQYLKKSK